MLAFVRSKKKLRFRFFVLVFLAFQMELVGAMESRLPDTLSRSEQDCRGLPFPEDLKNFCRSTFFGSLRTIFICDEASINTAKNIFFNSFRSSNRNVLLLLQKFLIMLGREFLPEEDLFLAFNNQRANSFCDFLKLVLEFLCSENQRKLEKTELFKYFLTAARRQANGTNDLEAFARRTRSTDFSENEFVLLKNFLRELLSLPTNVSNEIIKYYRIVTLAEASYSALLNSVTRKIERIAWRRLGEEGVVIPTGFSRGLERRHLEFFAKQNFDVNAFLRSSLFCSFKQAFSRFNEIQSKTRRLFCFKTLFECHKRDLLWLDTFLTTLEANGGDQIAKDLGILSIGAVDAELFYKKLKMVLLELQSEDARSAQSNNFLQKVRELLGSFQQKEFEKTELFNSFQLAAKAQFDAEEKIISFAFEGYSERDRKLLLDYLDILVNSFSRVGIEKLSHFASFVMTFSYGLTCSEKAGLAYSALFERVRSNFFFKKDEKEFIRQPTAKFKDFLRMAASNENLSGSASQRIQNFDLSRCFNTDLKQLEFFLEKIIVDSLNQGSDEYKEKSNMITKGYGVLSFERARGAYEILLDRVKGLLFLNNEFGSFIKTSLFRRFQEAAKVQSERIASTRIRIESFNIDGDSDDDLRGLRLFLGKLETLYRDSSCSQDLLRQITRACGITSFESAHEAYWILLKKLDKKLERLFWQKSVLIGGTFWAWIVWLRGGRKAKVDAQTKTKITESKNQEGQT